MGIENKIREIKFRAWDCFNAVMVYSKDFPSLSEFFAYNEKCERGGNKTIYLEYLDLKDVNGIEIYEADRVEWVEEEPYDKRLFQETVEYHEGAFYPISTRPSTEFTVIGNIYEDPNV